MTTLSDHPDDVKLVIALRCETPRKIVQYLETQHGLNPKPFHQATPPNSWDDAPSFLLGLKFPIRAEAADFYAFQPVTWSFTDHPIQKYFSSAIILDQNHTDLFFDYFRRKKLQLPSACNPTWMLHYSPSPEILSDPKLSAQINAWRKPGSPGPKPDTIPAGRLTVGRRLKLWFIPGKMIDSLNKRGVKPQHRELYRIFGTFARSKNPSDHPPRHLAPEEARAIAELPDRLRPYWYEDIGIDQLTAYYQLRIQDMLYRQYGEYARSIENWGTTDRTVQRMLAFLREVGAIVSVWPGRPAHGDWLSELERKARLKKHDRITEHWVTRWMVAMSETQMRHFKWINAELKRRGLPPYLIYLR